MLGSLFYLNGTNRDINATQEITRDQTTGMLDGSVTVDHRLLTESGRKEIIQDHKDVANAVKDTVAVVDGIIESRDFIKNYESSTQNMTIDEKNTLDNLLRSLQVESKDNTVIPPFLIELMGRKSKALLFFKNRWTTIY